jgi:ABC-type polysaccharide/polyol phosphate transport system ATPase subunit
VDPDILVIDEILAVGDLAFQQKCFERLKQFRRAGKTIVFVSHSMSQIAENCDRAILLEKGRMVIDGVPEQVVELYKGLTRPELHVAEEKTAVSV